MTIHWLLTIFALVSSILLIISTLHLVLFLSPMAIQGKILSRNLPTVIPTSAYISYVI